MNKNHTFAPFAPFAEQQAEQLPHFPTGDLPGPLRDFVEAVSENLQVAADMVAVLVLAVLAVAVQGKFVVSPKAGWVEPVNLYTLVIARPSERKSPVLKEVTAVLHQFERQENERRQYEMAKQHLEEEKLKQEIDRLQASFFDNESENEDLLSQCAEKQIALSQLKLGNPLRLMVDDTTPEALASMMANQNGTAAVISTEGGVFDVLAGRYSGNVNVDVFTKAFSGDPINIERKGSPSIRIEAPVLTMLLTVQPQVLSAIMDNKAFRGRGFLARFLYSLPASPVGHRAYETTPVREEIKEKYKKLVLKLLSLPKAETPKRIRFSDEAHQYCKSFFHEIEAILLEGSEQIDDWLGKLHGQTCRIAALLHCAQMQERAEGEAVSGKTMQQAIELAYYFLSHARAAFAKMGMAESTELQDARYLLKRMQTAKDAKAAKLTRKELFDKCRSRFGTVEAMIPALELLQEHGYILMGKEATKGRPTEVIYINPQYLQCQEQRHESEIPSNEPICVFARSTSSRKTQTAQRYFLRISVGAPKQALIKRKYVARLKCL